MIRAAVTGASPGTGLGAGSPGAGCSPRSGCDDTGGAGAAGTRSLMMESESSAGCAGRSATSSRSAWLPQVERIAARKSSAEAGRSSAQAVRESAVPPRRSALSWRRDDLLIQPVGFHDGVAHLGLGQFLAEPSIMTIGVFSVLETIRSRSLVRELVGRRKRDQPSVDSPQADAPWRRQEGTRASMRAADCGDHRQDVRVVLPIGRDGACLDLDLVISDTVSGEKRPDRPVDEPRREDLLGGGASFAA